MRVRARTVATVQLAAVVGVAVAGAVGAHRLGAVAYLRVDWGDLPVWLAVTAAEDVLVAVVRVVALGCAWWLLGTTVAYTLARLSGIPTAVRAAAWVAVPSVRGLVDRAVAVTLVGSSVVGGAGAAAAAGPPSTPAMATAVVVQDDGERGDGYQAVPAGQPTSAVTPGVSELSGLPPRQAPAAVGPPPPTGLPAEPGLQPPTSAPPPQTTATAAGPPNDPAGGRRPPQPPTGVARDATYTVAAGDHLWSIAAQTLTAAWGRKPSLGEVTAYWRRLVDVNVGGLRSGDPDLIYPGEVVELPEVPSKE